jgi:hypothetical protein
MGQYLYCYESGAASTAVARLAVPGGWDGRRLVAAGRAATPLPGGLSDWLHGRPELDLWVATPLPGGVRLVTRATRTRLMGCHSTPGGVVRLVTWHGPYWLSSIEPRLDCKINVVKSANPGGGERRGVADADARGGALHVESS